MKSIKTVLIAVAVVLAAALPASAQFRFGPRLGTQINSLSFDKDVFNSENRAGFTGGLMIEFTVPVVNLGFDLSAMYVHRVDNVKSDNLAANFKSFKGDYIEIPLHLKWKLGLPLVGKIVSPYIFTGPSAAFLASKRAITEAYSAKKCSWSWDFGLGVELFRHLQVGASYGLGMNKIIEATGTGSTVDINGKNKYWTVTAAWLF